MGFRTPRMDKLSLVRARPSKEMRAQVRKRISNSSCSATKRQHFFFFFQETVWRKKRKCLLQKDGQIKKKKQTKTPVPLSFTQHCIFRAAPLARPRRLRETSAIAFWKGVLGGTQLCLGRPFFMRAALGLGMYWLLAWCSSSRLKYWMVLFKPSSRGTCRRTTWPCQALGQKHAHTETETATSEGERQLAPFSGNVRLRAQCRPCVCVPCLQRHRATVRGSHKDSCERRQSRKTTVAKDSEEGLSFAHAHTTHVCTKCIYLQCSAHAAVITEPQQRAPTPKDVRTAAPSPGGVSNYISS